VREEERVAVATLVVKIADIPGLAERFNDGNGRMPHWYETKPCVTDWCKYERRVKMSARKIVADGDNSNDWKERWANATEVELSWESCCVACDMLLRAQEHQRAAEKWRLRYAEQKAKQNRRKKT
jgi:hypothetical protein